MNKRKIYKLIALGGGLLTFSGFLIPLSSCSKNQPPQNNFRVIPEDLLSFENEGSYFSLAGYDGDISQYNKLEVPKFHNGLPVNEIGRDAFNGCDNLIDVDFGNVSIIRGWAFCDTGLLKVTLPSTLTQIQQAAFYDCRHLTGDISIPASLTQIDIEAFAFCPLNSITNPIGRLNSEYSVVQLGGVKCVVEGTVYNGQPVAGQLACGENLSFDDSIVNIDDDAFDSCSGIRGTITLPPYINRFGDSAFGHLENVTGITNSVGALHSTFYIVQLGGVKCVVAGSSYTGQAVAGSLAFGTNLDLSSTSLTTITEKAFWDCDGIKGSITLPNTVTTIGNEAFTSCAGVTTINLSSIAGLTAIGEYAFAGCFNIASLAFASTGLITIGACAFSFCEAISGSLVFPNSVTTIGPDAFQNTPNISSITLPTGLTGIGDEAFLRCGSTNTIIQNTAGNIGSYKLFEFGSVKILVSGATYTGQPVVGNLAYGSNLDLSTTSLTTIGTQAFASCYGISGTITFPSTLTEIKDYAFYNCHNINGLLIMPDNLTKIGMSAFELCDSITALTIDKKCRNMGLDAFSDDYNISSLTLNLDSQPNWAAFAGGWKDDGTVKNKGTWDKQQLRIFLIQCFVPNNWTYL